MTSNGSWQKVRFDEICKNVSKRVDNPQESEYEKFVGLEHLDTLEPKITRYGSTNDVTSSMTLFKNQQILFGRRNWYLRRVAVADFDGLCSGDIYVLEAIDKKIIKEFLPLLMHSDEFFEKNMMYSHGSMSTRVKWSNLAKLEFIIPPIEKQENILSLTHKIDQTISYSQKLLEKTKNYMISRRELLLTRGIGHTKFKKVKWYYGKTIEIPEEWGVYPLEKICDVLDNKRVPVNATRRKKMKGSIPYYGANKIVDYVNDFIFNEKIIFIKKYGGNFYDYLKKPIAQFVTGKCWVNNHAHVLKANLKYITPEFLFYSLNHRNIIPFVQGGTRSKLNQDEGGLKEIPICLPKISEQNQITQILENIKNSELMHESHLTNLKVLRKSILNSKLTKEKTNVAN